MVPAIDGRKAEEDDCNDMQMAEAREVAPREIEGADGDGHVAARKRTAVTLEIRVEQFHKLEKWAYLHRRRICQGIEGKTFLTRETWDLRIKDKRPYDRQEDECQETDVKDKGDDGDIMKKPLLLLKIKGKADPGDHDII